MTFPFKIPFATSGNQTAIPETDLSGFVNFTDGYTPDYQLDPETDPNGKVIERDKWNWLFNRITSAIGEVQRNGAAEWYSALAPYGLGSVVARAGKIWQSTVTNNSTEPGDVGASWVDITALAATETAVGRVLLASQADAEPVNIGSANNAKAATVLRVFQALRSALANATETVRGSVRIATVAEVNAGGADDCALSPAKGVALLNSRALGIGQTYQNVTASRLANVTYTNTTGRPILCIYTYQSGDGQEATVSIDGVAIAGRLYTGTSYFANRFSVTFLVPHGSSYSLNGSVITSGYYMELR